MKTMKEILINCLRKMKRKAHGAQKPKHIQRYVEVAITAQRSDSLAQAINQCSLKRASNSLLILLAHPFMALRRVLVSAHGGAGASMRHSPLAYIFRPEEGALCRAIFQASGSLRSFNPTRRLGEERIRGSFYGLLLFCLLTSYAAGETPAPAAEEISAIIRTEIMAMPEWSDADIRIEITGGIKSLDFPASGESFRLAPKGLTIGRRNVFAPIDIIRDGKIVRSLSVPAVVYVSAPAVTVSRKIASGEVIAKKDIIESKVETTDIGSFLARNPEDVVGRTARRVFAAGDPLPLEAFSEPLLVRRGDMVNLRLKRDGITLTSTARAAENGRLGEIIQVKSLDFSSVIRARVTGQSEVSIQ
jgi:flagella basal body P-ring formation protein FlgA